MLENGDCVMEKLYMIKIKEDMQVRLQIDPNMTSNHHASVDSGYSFGIAVVFVR